MTTKGSPRKSLYLGLTLGLGACGPAVHTEVPPGTPPALAPPSASLASSPGVAATAPPARASYAGHGAASAPAEILAKFAPKPLAGEVSRRIQTMLDVRAPGVGELSPDGQSLYFSWTVTGVRHLWRLDGPRRFPMQLTGGEDATTLAAVVPDGSELVLSRDRAGEENPGLYLQKPEGGPMQLVQHEPGVQTALQLVTDDSRWIYFRSNDVAKDSFVIYRYDRTSRQREVVLDTPGLWSVSDHRPDGRLLLAKAVGANMAEYYELAPGERTPKPLFGQGEREEYVALWAARPDEVIVRTSKLGEYRRLYRFKAGKFTPITPELKHEVASFSMDPKKQRLTYHVNEGGFTRLHALDARTYAETKLPAMPAADHVVLQSHSRDGRFAVIGAESSQSPGRTYVLDWATRKLTEWVAPSAPEVDTRRFAVQKLMSYPARDGTAIPMFVRRPSLCDEPCPVVVSFHGGPESQSKPGFNTRGQLFVDAGFVYVEPNVRGSDGYGKTWLHADDGAKRLAVITDIEDAARYIRGAWAKDGKPPKIGVMGGSYGGYSAQIAMTMFAGAYDAGASAVGISDLLTFLRNTAPYRRALRISEYGDPDKDADALRKLSPIHYVDQVKGPMLLTQGASDPRVPVGESLQVYRALEAKGLPVELMIFADEGHSVQKRGNQVLQLGHMVRFFEQHLMPGPARPAAPPGGGRRGATSPPG